MSSPRIKKAVPKLRRSSNGMLMAPEEFDAVTDCDELYQYELIHGVLVVNPPPAESERDPNGELGYLLRLYRDSHPQGSSLDATLSEQYVYLADSRRRADRVIWTGLGRVPDPETDVPTIVVEFVSQRQRDRQRDYEEKRREYLALGVAEVLGHRPLSPDDDRRPQAPPGTGRAGAGGRRPLPDAFAAGLRTPPGAAAGAGRSLDEEAPALIGAAEDHAQVSRAGRFGVDRRRRGVL